ncbi:MAG: AAA family ATPase [Planctomycetes bacterium]|nr:AAA family ATPase [Planctomycetota bacterium]MBL7144655.1 AAA family ATPase [Phycisphaerae bacterium]
MFKSIKIKNLRAITELEINNLGQVNLFVGNNNCGKTTILEALFFIIGNNNPNLPVNANAFRGLNFLSNEYWDSFFHNMEADSNIRISVILHKMQEEQKLVIRPVIKKQTTAKPVSSDIVSIGIQNGDAKPAFTPNGLELIYTSSQDPTAKSISSIVLKGNELITEGTKESFVRGVFVGPATKFDWKTRFASIQRKKRVGELISSLKEIESDISDIRINEVGILEADVGLCKLIPVNLMGGGIANSLSILLGMLDSEDGIVLIDEIENGLHHSIQQKIWKAVFKWAQNLNVQVFATTHSNECIRAFSNSVDTTLFGSEAKLFRIERKDEKFRAVEYSKELLKESVESNWEVR